MKDSNGQDFEFKWHARTFPHGVYDVNITRLKARRKIEIIFKEFNNTDSIKCRISKRDCDSLYNFCLNYDYPIKGSIIKHSYRDYVDTISLNNETWVLLEGDSIHKELIRPLGYYWDSDSNRFYTEKASVKAYTDGNTYSGEFNSNEISSNYNVYGARIDKDDYELNNLIFYLIETYNRDLKLYRLKKTIENDQPVPEKSR